MAVIGSVLCGLTLKSPIIVGSSGKTGSADHVAELAAAGAGAVVLKSIFEEQILDEAAREAGKGGIVYGQDDLDGYIKFYEKKHSIAQYVRLVRDSKAGCSIPVIASVNATSGKEWQNIASELAGAGADAIQLNLFVSPFDDADQQARIEDTYTDTVRTVKAITKLPVIAKIGSYFTSIPGIVGALRQAGADGVVLFNRYYTPDFDIEKLSALPSATLSQPSEYLMSLRWVSLLSWSAGIPLVGASGIHDGKALIKLLLAGAPAVEVVSTVYRHGLKQIKLMNDGLAAWMDAHGHATIESFRGTMAVEHGANRSALERFHYMKTYGGVAE
ncbi:MAG TPA: dihydroorotate dehydrogenase-like protein [bacterium]|nr:dihydroorotate dehydrogenase-like protein [bacterium]